ncbi:hypothetical protein LB823_01175 [Tsukamurella sp. M9C]|uniref:ADP-ribosyltransferase domain-containing protein n=1 Tax=Tsukamurella sp. M9C TaxID=2877520 RepID=UPI001CCBAD83|nr:ADP-ribosyltransferase domain-containing protein [Tsukamurella sp. M9C]MCA0154799.1 hypothetical protein [Tsukamurella sp. M9C]
MSFDITPGDGIVGELELLGDLIVGGFPEAVFTLPGVSVDEVLDHARLYLGFAEAAESAHARVRGLEVPEFVGVEGQFFRGRVPGELAMQLGAAVESYSRVGSGIKELARELDASQAALKPLEARARAVFEHMQKVWIKVNVPFTEYSGLRSEWDELVRAAGVVHERVAVAGQQAAAVINAGTEAMVPVNDYFSTLPGGAVAGGVVAQGARSTASRAASAAGGVTGAPGRAAKATADGLGAVAGAVTSVPQQITARGQQLAPQVTPDGIKVGDQLLTDPTSEQAQKLVRDGQATNILGLDPTGVPTAMMMLASPNTLLREQPRKKSAGRRWSGEESKAQSIAENAVGQVVSVPGRFVGGAVDRFGNTIAGNAALIGVGGDPVRAWTGLLSNVTSPVAGAGRAVASATPEQILADPVAAAGSAATHAPAAVPFVGWVYGLVEWATKPGELAREGAKETLTSALDALTLKNLEAGQAVANTGEVHVTTPDVDIHADNGGYVTFTLPDLEGGEPKAWYILATPDSPGNFTTNVATGPDEELIERADGSVVLVNSGTGQIVRTIKTPWAKDAVGRDQPTWYSIDKVDDQTSTITQHIAPNKNALYPLIADAPAGAQIKPPSGSQIADISGGATAGASAGASVGQVAGGSAPTVQSDGFSGPTTTNAVNAPFERPQGNGGTTTPNVQSEPYSPSAGASSGGTANTDPQPYRPTPAPEAPPKPDAESGQDDKQPDTYVGAVTDTGSSFQDVSGSEVGVKSVADPNVNTGGGVPAPGDRSAELTRLVQSGLMNSAMLQALGYHIDPSGKVVKDTGPIVSVELAPDLGQSPVAGLIVPQLQAGGAQVKVKSPVPGTPQDNDISSVSIGDPGKQVDTYLVRGDGATSRTQSTRTLDGIETITQTFDGTRIDGHTTLSPDGKPVSSTWTDTPGNQGTVDNTSPQQRTHVDVADQYGGGYTDTITTGETGNVYETTGVNANGDVIESTITNMGQQGLAKHYRINGVDEEVLAASRINELGDPARLKIFNEKVKPAQEAYERAVRDLYMSPGDGAAITAAQGQVKRTYAALIEALGEYGLVPKFDPSQIIQTGNGTYEAPMTGPDGKPIIGGNGKPLMANIVARPDGGFSVAQDVGMGINTSTISSTNGYEGTQYMSKGVVQDKSLDTFLGILDVVGVAAAAPGAGRALGGLLRVGGEQIASNALKEGGEKAAVAALRTTTDEASGIAARQSLTGADRQAILDYTGNKHYQTLNAGLRSGVVTGEQRTMANAINAALAKLPDYSGQVVRGVDLSPADLARYQPGAVVREAPFTSTTIDPTKAFSGNTRFIIQSTSGKYVEPLSAIPGEMEVLFPTDSLFQVLSKSVDPVTGETIIAMIQRVAP